MNSLRYRIVELLKEITANDGWVSFSKFEECMFCGAYFTKDDDKPDPPRIHHANCPMVTAKNILEEMK